MLAERLAFPNLPKRFARPLPAWITDVNEFAAAAEELGITIAELRWLCQQDGSLWLDAARVKRLAHSKANEMRKGATRIIEE